MNTLPHELERTIVINAPRETVFGFFTDSAQWATWWGAGSTIDPHVGGRVYIRYPGNVEVSGAVVALTAPSHFTFTYGFESGTPFGPGESQVHIHLEPEGKGTRLTLSRPATVRNVSSPVRRKPRCPVSASSMVDTNVLASLTNRCNRADQSCLGPGSYATVG